MPVINGTTGDDSIVGTSGADTISGGGGNDSIDGAGGNDSITGSASSDYLFGGAGADTINGGDGSDHLSSAAFQYFDWGSGDPLWDVGSEVDVLNAGAGDDWIAAGCGDVVDGGAGYDYLYLSYRGLGFGITADFRALAGQALSVAGVSLNGVEYIYGLQGTEFDDVLYSLGAATYGLGGNDHIVGANILDGGSGNDLVEIAAGSAGQAFGGEGDDTLHGGTGFDSLQGGDGNDLIVAGLLGDSIDGGDGNDTITGGPGNDAIGGGAGDDLITAGDGKDGVSGGEGNDTIDAGAGMNNISGDDGDDLIYAGDDAADLNGGFGFDILSYERVSYGVNVELNGTATKNGNYVESIFGFEELVGSAYNDTLSGQSPPYAPAGTSYTLEGAAGNDFVSGGAGNDVLYGDRETSGAGDGDDTLAGWYGDDTLIGGGGTDTAVYSYASDQYAITYHVDSGTFTVVGPYGIEGADVLSSIERLQFSDTTLNTADLKSNPNGAGDDSILGTAGADALAGHAGNDTITGGAGNDTLDGGLGDDSIDGGTGADTATYADAVDQVHVSLAIAGAQDTGSAGHDTLTSIENLQGGDYADSLTGDATANVLSGGAGYDTLDGGGGNDTLVGGDDNDTYYVDSSQDVVQETEVGGIGDSVISTAGSYVLADFVEGLRIGQGGINAVGNGLDNWMYGSTAANVIEGMDGNDSIYGGAGGDSLDGGAGNDELYADGIYDQGYGFWGQTLEGGAGNDLLYGGDGNDRLIGDKLTDSTGAGDDTIYGNGGIDTVVYRGNSSQYVVSGSGNSYTVTGIDGTDTLTDVEYIEFDDRTISVTDSKAPTVLSVTPGAGATGVLSNTPIVITFDEPVTGGYSYVEVISDLRDMHVYELGNYGTGTTFVLNPQSEWDPASVYTITILADAARDTSGNSIAESSTTFTTQWVGVNIASQFGGASGFGANDTLTGASQADRLDGNGGNDLLYGGAGDDALSGGSGNDYIDGGTGTDTALYDYARSAYAISVSPQQTIVTGPDGTDTLVGVERLDFTDHYHVTFDIAGNAGLAYRLYQAAFDRKPDLGGLGYQMNDLNRGVSLEQVAANFIASPEFQTTYGSVDNTQFLTLLYKNVLHRDPDTGGLQFHLDEFAHGETRAQMLIHFSESPENQANVIGDIQDGITYVW